MLQYSKLHLESLVWPGTWVLNLSLKIMHSRAQLEYPFMRPSVIAELGAVWYIADLSQRAVVFVFPLVRHILLVLFICFSQSVFIQQLSPSQCDTEQEGGEGQVVPDPFSVCTAGAAQGGCGSFLCPSCCCFCTPPAAPAVCLLGDESNHDNAC